MSGQNVDLGFFNGDYPGWQLEKTFEDFELESRHFPSKVGGKPAWLDLTNIPKSGTVKCQKCGDPLRFLLQVYSPDEAVNTAFHRTIFLFLCPNNSCWDDSVPPVLVLRSQLARNNPFYPASPPEERPDWRPDIRPDAFTRLCPVCGGRADKSCSRCGGGVAYCGQAHQKLDWRAGHKKWCAPGAKYGGPHALVGFREGLLEIEEEPREEAEAAGTAMDVDLSRLVDGGGQIVAAEDTKDLPAEEWEDVESGQPEDKASEKFNKRIRRAPQQIIRYDRRGAPLLVTFTTPLSAPPPCPACGAQRTFEFQVMPQLLSLLGLGSDPLAEGGVDWGSIYVFTCDRSCEIEGYQPEVAILLNFDPTNLPTN